MSSIVAYSVLRPSPAREVAIPERYAAEVRRVYEVLGLERREVAPILATGPTSMLIEADDRWGLGRIVLRSVGDDGVAAIEQQRRQLCDRGLEVIHVELPMRAAGAAVIVDALHDLGFFYAGLIPELRQGDVLRMQHLTVDVDPSRLHLYGDNAARLLEYTLADRAS